MLHQGMDKLTAAVDQEVLAGFLFQTGDFFRNIVEATYLGRLFIRSAKPSSSVIDGQTLIGHPSQ